MWVAMSAWLMMPTSSRPSMTGSRRTLLSIIVRSASSIESSAPMVTVLPSPTPSSPAVTLEGSLPSASTFTTMSRSVSMPLRRSSSPQIGMLPTSSWASCFAASSTLSFSPTHVQSSLMMSRAFLSDMGTPSWLLARKGYPRHAGGPAWARGLRSGALRGGCGGGRRGHGVVVRDDHQEQEVGDEAGAAEQDRDGEAGADERGLEAEVLSEPAGHAGDLLVGGGAAERSGGGGRVHAQDDPGWGASAPLGMTPTAPSRAPEAGRGSASSRMYWAITAAELRWRVMGRVLPCTMIVVP